MGQKAMKNANREIDDELYVLCVVERLTSRETATVLDASGGPASVDAGGSDRPRTGAKLHWCNPSASSTPRCVILLATMARGVLHPHNLAGAPGVSPSIAFRLSPTLTEALDQAAEDAGVTGSAMVRRVPEETFLEPSS